MISPNTAGEGIIRPPAWRRKATTIGERSTWPVTLPPSAHTTPLSGRSMRCTSRGFHSTPPLAMAAMACSRTPKRKFRPA